MGSYLRKHLRNCTDGMSLSRLRPSAHLKGASSRPLSRRSRSISWASTSSRADGARPWPRVRQSGARRAPRPSHRDRTCTPASGKTAVPISRPSITSPPLAPRRALQLAHPIRAPPRASTSATPVRRFPARDSSPIRRVRRSRIRSPSTVDLQCIEQFLEPRLDIGSDPAPIPRPRAASATARYIAPVLR